MAERTKKNRDRPYGNKQKASGGYKQGYDRRSSQQSSQREGRGTTGNKQRKYEEYAWVLAYLLEGSPTDPLPFGKREPVIQAVGEIWFTLLELIPKRGISVKPLTRIGIGKKNRRVITRIKRRISYDDLSPSSEGIFEECILEIIQSQEFRFVNWFNKASLVTSRMHSFKLLPGIGTTNLETLIQERNRVQFTSFEDIAKRTKISDPKKLIAARILKELTNPDEKYRLFTRKP